MSNNINMLLAQAIGLDAETLKNTTGFNLRCRADKMPTITLQRFVFLPPDVAVVSEHFEWSQPGALSEARALLRLTARAEQRLAGESKVLRELLGEAATVIATLEGQCSTEQAMLDELRFTIDKALHPTPDGGLL